MNLPPMTPPPWPPGLIGYRTAFEIVGCLGLCPKFEWGYRALNWLMNLMGFLLFFCIVEQAAVYGSETKVMTGFGTNL